jgi:protein-disulfide isomerase
MHVAQHEGKMDIVEKIYSLKINPREKNTKKILAAVKKQTNYSVTQKQIDAKSVKDAIKADGDSAAKMMVSGTPTIYLDGEWDKMRNGYKKFIK